MLHGKNHRCDKMKKKKHTPRWLW